MTLVSLTDCSRLLVIDAKTLRRWLSLAHLSVQPHSLDARLKCVTHEQLEQLAPTHHRSLPASGGLPVPPETSALSTPTSGMSASVFSCVVSDFSAHITDLTKQLVGLQTHVATLQHQLSLLAEQFQREQAGPTSAASMFKEKSQQSCQEKSQQSCQEKSQQSCQEKSQQSCQEKSQQSCQEKSQETSLAPTPSASSDRRKHPHVLPLVEYGAQGKYVVISPELGRLSFEPDAPEWFAWLSTLPSFRFVGQQGRFTAFRGYQCSKSTPWWAHRQIRNHSHKRRLGLTAELSIESLELAAASLQALM
jgi:hypothetical protein